MIDVIDILTVVTRIPDVVSYELLQWSQSAVVHFPLKHLETPCLLLRSENIFPEKTSVFISINVTSCEKRPVTKVEFVLPLSLASCCYTRKLLLHKCAGMHALLALLSRRSNTSSVLRAFRCGRCESDRFPCRR